MLTVVLKKLGLVGMSLAMTAGVTGLSFAPALASASSASDPSRFIAPLHPLNGSGVTGFANLSLDDQQPGANLVASVNARGTVANQVHPLHIHGMTTGGASECPTTTADTNLDGFVSVFEGAPFYGAIKVSFTTPPTPFGPPANTTLFAPYAGTPITANFPHSTNNGNVFYNQTIPFDESNHYAVEALDGIMPLNAQHIVLHGGYAPESVDTPGGNPNKIVYDALLPIACGPIIQTHRGSQNTAEGNGQAGNATATINETGAGSVNLIDEYTSSSTNVTNTNNVRTANSNSQTSRSGNVFLDSNTVAGDASSGDASNYSVTNSMVSIMNSSIH
jgi:hypothetical protein